LTPDAADAAKTIGQVLWDDLNYEKEFYMIPRDTYGTIPASRSADDVQFAAWRELGADAVVVGTVRRAGNEVSVQVRLVNVRTRQSVYGKEYSGKPDNPDSTRTRFQTRSIAAAESSRCRAHEIRVSSRTVTASGLTERRNA
jgi:TolB-like protein